MSVERHRQSEQRHRQILRADMIPARVDWDLLIHDVAPPQTEIPLGDFIFSREVMYRPSRSTYSTRGVNSLEDLEIDCE